MYLFWYRYCSCSVSGSCSHSRSYSGFRFPAFPDALSVKGKTSEVSSFSRNEIDSSREMSKIEELAVKTRSTANDSTYSRC